MLEAGEGYFENEEVGSKQTSPESFIEIDVVKVRFFDEV